MQKEIFFFEYCVFVLSTQAAWWVIVRKIFRKHTLEFAEDAR